MVNFSSAKREEKSQVVPIDFVLAMPDNGMRSTGYPATGARLNNDYEALQGIPLFGLRQARKALRVLPLLRAMPG